jgi:hypothetical protein
VVVSEQITPLPEAAKRCTQVDAMTIPEIG